MAFREILDRFGRSFIPLRLRDPLRNYLLTAGYQHVPYSLFGILFFSAVIVTYFLFLAIFPLLVEKSLGLIFLGTLFFWIVSISLLVGAVMFFTWSFLNLRIYKRTKDMEEALPEYLALVVTNLRSGMSFDKSLWAAIRPEFGVLGREIRVVSKRVMTGNDTGEALREFAQRYESPSLRRSITLIISEIDSGGEIASVIERIIEHLRKTRELKKEMAASVINYMIFISVIVVVLAPILFALANTLLTVILNFAGQIAGTSVGNTGSAGQIIQRFERLDVIGETLIENFHLFSYLALAVISLFAGVIVSIIEKGDVRGGLKYVPVFLATTLFLFWLADTLIKVTFGSLL